MPATNRKGSAGGGLLDALDERARPKAVDNFSSIDTYYRSAKLWLRQVGLWCKAVGAAGGRQQAGRRSRREQ